MNIRFKYASIINKYNMIEILKFLIIRQAEQEPWDKIESKLVWGSIIAGIIALILLAIIINVTILAKY